MDSVLKTIFSRRMLVAFLMGFSCGLPLLLTIGVLQAWMKETGVNLTWIGMITLVQIPYTWKFIWAPFLDRFVPPFLGRRRGWMLMAQLALMLAIAGLGYSDPVKRPLMMVAAAVLVAFFSATQDIVVDAYRREDLADKELGLGSSFYIYGYRVGMWLAGGGGLILADQLSYTKVYLIMAACMLPGVLTTLLSPEPAVDAKPPLSMREAVVAPLVEYFSRRGAVWILAFILFYKIGDTMASAITTPFFLDIGFTKTEIGAVVKLFGAWATIGGALLGGLVHAEAGHLSLSVDFRLLTGFFYRRFCFARQGRPQYFAALGRHRIRKLEQRHGHSRLCRLHGQHHEQTIYRHPVCPADQHYGNSAGAGLCAHRVHGQVCRMGSVFHLLYAHRCPRPAAIAQIYVPQR